MNITGVGGAGATGYGGAGGAGGAGVELNNSSSLQTAAGSMTLPESAVRGDPRIGWQRRDRRRRYRVDRFVATDQFGKDLHHRRRRRCRARFSGGTGVSLHPGDEQVETLETTAGGRHRDSRAWRGRAAGATAGFGVSILNETVRTQGGPGTIVISGESPGTAAGVAGRGKCYRRPGQPPAISSSAPPTGAMGIAST